MKVNVPTVFGVPVNPPPLANAKPFGNVPADTAKVYGAVPPVAVNVWLYAVPTKPFAKVAGLIVMAGQGGKRSSV